MGAASVTISDKFFLPSIKSETAPSSPLISYVDEKKTQVGYEISFNKYFYKQKELRTISVLIDDLLELEIQTDGMLSEIIGGISNE